MKHLDDLKALRPCHEALEWVLEQPSLEVAWETCERADWMLWFAQRKGLLDKPVSVRLACAFAQRVLGIYETKNPGNLKPREAIDAALRWLESPAEANRKAAADAADAAYAAADAADAAADAAYAAADAAYAAAAAAYAAADAAYDAADAADAAAYAVRAEERKWQANEVRKVIANPFKS